MLIIANNDAARSLFPQYTQYQLLLAPSRTLAKHFTHQDLLEPMHSSKLNVAVYPMMKLWGTPLNRTVFFAKSSSDALGAILIF
jgi:hypothetical protein